VVLPLGAAIAFKMARGAIVTAAVAAIMTAAIGSVFCFHCIYSLNVGRYKARSDIGLLSRAHVEFLCLTPLK
jgi:hypothetical protein